MKIAIIDDERCQYDILKDTCIEYGNNNNIKIDIRLVFKPFSMV